MAASIEPEGNPTTEKGKIAQRRIVWQGGSYDIQDGVIVRSGENRIYLDDRKKDLMDIFTRSLIDVLENTPEKEVITGGWIITKDIIRDLFEETIITKDLENSFWYYLREVKKTLDGCLGEDSEKEAIERRRAGRNKSYYRLNPEVFQLANPDVKGDG